MSDRDNRFTWRTNFPAAPLDKNDPTVLNFADLYSEDKKPPSEKVKPSILSKPWMRSWTKGSPQSDDKPSTPSAKPLFEALTTSLARLFDHLDIQALTIDAVKNAVPDEVPDFQMTKLEEVRGILNHVVYRVGEMFDNFSLDPKKPTPYSWNEPNAIPHAARAYLLDDLRGMEASISRLQTIGKQQKQDGWTAPVEKELGEIRQHLLECSKIYQHTPSKKR